jgi:pimeloyl-ACP methyl ester carboxylesterase
MSSDIIPEGFASERTQYVNVAGCRTAYRVVGSGEPLLLLNRFRATLDDWDPAFVAALARNSRVIAFDSMGVGATSGATPATLEAASDFAVQFARSIDVTTADVLGWSMGGMTAQIVALEHPKFVRNLILAGTLPPGGSPEVIPSSPEWSKRAGKVAYEDEDIQYLFFTTTAASRAAGRASLDRLSTLKGGRLGSSIGSTPETAGSQLQAIIRHYKNQAGYYARLKHIGAPTFVANGDRDGAFPAIDSVVLAREIPNSRLAIYPDSGHGFLFQYPEQFAADVGNFLSAVSRP